MRKDKPIGDGTRPEPGRAMSLEGSTPSPSACRLRDWSKGTTPGFQPGDRGSNPRSRTRSDRLMRPWPSGQARASQARQAGSTPAGRSRESANR